MMETAPVACPSCEAENVSDARFCNRCGTALVAQEGERRQITVLFSDLSGYTAMSERLDPEDVQSIINRIFGPGTEIVEHYGGRVDRFLGDAMMAVFGDPVVHEDDAERAVRAALDLHAAVDRLSPEVEAEIGRPITMHSGINSGLVVTSGLDLDTAVGDAINVASRLEGLAEPGEILIGPETARLVGGVFDTEDHGERDLKGKSGPVAVTKVLGVASARSEPSRRQAAFVGRQEELGVLLGAVERLRDGESSVVSIRAEAGAGKTRLLNEFRHRLGDDVQWLEGRAYAYGENIPYAAVIDLVARAVGITEDDDPAAVQSKLRSTIGELVDDPDAIYAPLARLFGLAAPEGVALDRETYQARLLDSTVGITEALARGAPTVIAFQDLHWADPSTVRLILGLIDRLETAVVVVANFRPEFTLGATGEHQLDLGELSPRQTGDLITSLLDGQSAPDQLFEFIVGRTDGNPFFVEEILNSLVETGALHTSHGDWTVEGDLHQLDVPTSIRGVIAARIDRLDDSRRRVLREASVIGREFLYDVVRRVTTTSDELAPSLDALEAADLIREKAPDPDLEYFFKHALTQDVAYDGLLRSEREKLHAKAAAAIESQFAERLEEVTETLAFHYLNSGITDKAVTYLAAAGHKAVERFALAEAQSHYEQAYQLLEDEPDSAERDSALVDLILEWAFLAYYQARLHDLRQLLVAHQDVVDRVGDAERLGMWTAWIGHAEMTAEGDFAGSLVTLDRALEIGEAAELHRVTAYVQAWRVYSLLFLGRLDDAIAAGRAVRPLRDELVDEPYPWFKAVCGLGLAQIAKGEFGEAVSIADELIAYGDATGSARAASMGYLVRTNLAHWVNDAPAAVEAARLATETASDPIYQHSPSVSLMFALIGAERTEAARLVYEAHWHQYVEDQHVRFLARLFSLGDGLITVQEGNWTQGFDKVESVDAEAGHAGEFLIQHWAAHSLAILYAQVAMADTPGLGQVLRNARFVAGRGRNATREAHNRLEDVLDWMDQTGSNGMRFQAEYTYAELLAAEGDRNAAVRHLERAIQAVLPAGDTAGLRNAQAALESLRA